MKNLISALIKKRLIRVTRYVSIYFDMDNTLDLWCNKGEDKLSLEKVAEKGFFRNLEPLDDCCLAIPLLQELGLGVFVKSACSQTPYCKPEKMEWLAHFLPTISEKNIILCELGENKSENIPDIQNSILVDDYGNNLDEWIKAGGIAIKKSHSNKERKIPVLKNHMDIFDIMFDMGIIEIVS